jgi:hypothetical protein
MGWTKVKKTKNLIGIVKCDCGCIPAITPDVVDGKIIYKATCKCGFEYRGKTFTSLIKTWNYVSGNRKRHLQEMRQLSKNRRKKEEFDKSKKGACNG